MALCSWGRLRVEGNAYPPGMGPYGRMGRTERTINLDDSYTEEIDGLRMEATNERGVRPQYYSRSKVINAMAAALLGDPNEDELEILHNVLGVDVLRRRTNTEGRARLAGSELLDDVDGRDLVVAFRLDEDDDGDS